jgi:transcriptional regulator GlxA family with amidase domain
MHMLSSMRKPTLALAIIIAGLLGCSGSPPAEEERGAVNALRPASPPVAKGETSGVAPQSFPIKLRRTLGIVLYPGFELLDVYGPAGMFGHVGITGTSSTVGLGIDIVMIAESAGSVQSAQGPSVVADFGFANAPPLDLLMVPGGLGTVTELVGSSTLDFLRQRAADAELVMSVCTGSAILARAGLLDGYKATSNKRLFALARVSGPNVTWIEKARWVEDRNRVTSSGITAGIDMSLAVIARLWSTQTATDIAHDMEYTWHSDPSDDPFFEP